MTNEIEVARGVIEELQKHQTELGPYLQKLWHWVRNGTETIIVVGPGGVGKTTLGQLLSGEALSPKDYAESINVEQFTYKGKVFGSIIVAPGQDQRIAFHWPALKRKIFDGKISGVIYVVAGGYRAWPPEIELRRFKLYDETQSLADFLPRYRSFYMEKDVDVLRNELKDALRSSPRRIWFVTAIAKQDLWADDDTVLDFYEKSGPYAELIKEIEDFRHPEMFPNECFPLSLLLQNLQIKGGRVLAKTVSGFDTSKQINSVTTFLRKLNEFIMDREVRSS